ncbi:MAG TPA: SCO family protein [Anaerolineales bacterium]|nr:SCO family protein [Anaerolineales bacterium]
MKASLWFIGVGSFLLVGLLLMGRQVLSGGYTFQGSLIDPPAPAADFALRDQNGEVFRLSDQKGKVVLIFFGYTHCPDVCPITLTDFKRIKDELGDLAVEVRFVLITVDPERDTVERLRNYLPGYDPSFYGLTGERAQLEKVWRSYGVYQAGQEAEGEAGYEVEHTARIYAIDKHGSWRLTYPLEMGRKAVIEDVRHLLKEN